MKITHKLILWGLVPLPMGWVYVHLLAFVLRLEPGALRDFLHTALPTAVSALYLWGAVRLAADSRRVLCSPWTALFCLTAPGLLLLAMLALDLSPTLARTYFAPLDGSILMLSDLPVAELPACAFDLLTLAAACFVGRRISDTGDTDTFFTLLLLRVGLTALGFYSSHLNGSNTDLLLGPFISIAALALAILQIKTELAILFDVLRLPRIR